MSPLPRAFLLCLLPPALIGLGLEPWFPVASAWAACLAAVLAACWWYQNVPVMPGLIQGVIATNGLAVLVLHTVVWFDLAVFRLPWRG